jgi:hypothetical protein
MEVEQAPGHASEPRPYTLSPGARAVTCAMVSCALDLVALASDRLDRAAAAAWRGRRT